MKLESEFGGDLLTGMMPVFGVDHHIRLIRVMEGDIVEPHPDAPEEVWDLFKDMQRFTPGAYSRVKVPGWTGQYVLMIYPFSE